MRTHLLFAALALPILFACSDDDGSALNGAPDAGMAQDTGSPDTNTDAPEPDAAVEASVNQEAGSPDTGVEVPEAGPTPPPEQPAFDDVASYGTTIAASGDPADIYYPNPADLSSGAYAFPIAALFQGAKVDKQYYAAFAKVVASYGFVVVVPNHESTGMMGSGLYMQPQVVNDVLAHMQGEQQSHPQLAGKLDVGTIVLLGHSYGGVVALHALQGICQFPFCVGGFDRPVELKAGALFGTNLKPPIGSIPETNNIGWALALVQGEIDGKASLADTQETYDKTTSPPKALITLTGVNHYGLCDVNNPPGADADSTQPLLDQPTSIETAARWSALFLRAHVLGDQGAAQYVHVDGDAADPNVIVQSVP